MSRSVTPRCCDAARKFIRLQYDYTDLCSGEDTTRDAYMEWVRQTPPQWRMSANVNAEWSSPEPVDVSFCPFCGGHLPRIQLRARPPKRICVVVDGGYYCDTCERRLNECRCPMPERLWEPVSQQRRVRFNDAIKDRR